MKVLVTGAEGFVGKNLTAALACIRDGKDRLHRITGLSDPSELEIVPYDRQNRPEELEEACKDCSFVFHLAGVNRPEDPAEFKKGNFGFTSELLDALKKYRNTCPVMLASSVQASLAGRFGPSDYGRSKLAGEELLFAYGHETGARVLVYRFPNIFGKWCRPNYNSAVATFCHNVAHDLPIRVNDRGTELELLYIDDLTEEMIAALNGAEHRCEFDGTDFVGRADGRYCYAPVTHKVTLGEIADLLERFREQPRTLVMPELPEGSFAKKLYSTYLSYLPEEKAVTDLTMNTDARGSFTELLRTEKCGQFSVNISRPGITKGEHWHHSKWELFIVVSGHGLIEERRIGRDEDGKPYPVRRYEVSGQKLQAVRMLPGYTHSITNLSATEDLVTVMWANEPFDPDRPDTFREQVEGV